MVKAILFDRHGVIDLVNGYRLLELISSYAKKDVDDLKIDLDESWLDYDLGIMEPFTFWSIFYEKYNFTDQEIDACRNYLNHPQIREALLDIIKSLSKYYSLNILSDCPKDKKQAVEQSFDLSIFDNIFRSCDYAKSKKQGKDFFNIASMYLEEQNIITNNEEILFIDDGEENIQTAQSLGMQTHLFTETASFIGFLDSHNIRY